MSRPSLLDPDRTQRITKLISAGNSVESASAASGISESTFYSWIARGKKERDRLSNSSRIIKPKRSELPFLEFLESIEKARGEAEAQMVLVIAKAAQKGTWQAAAWWLERTKPERWGRPWRPTPETPSSSGAIEKGINNLTNTPNLPGE